MQFSSYARSSAPVLKLMHKLAQNLCCLAIELFDCHLKTSYWTFSGSEGSL